MALSRAREQARKDDTRHKIELGGLVIKAGLGDEDKAVILGLLISASEAMKGPDGNRQRGSFQEVGSRAFLTGD